MKKPEINKKAWTKPVVNTLSIKKDTFSASSGTGAEGGGKVGPPTKKSKG
jgi:hypothetical protein